MLIPIHELRKEGYLQEISISFRVDVLLVTVPLRLGRSTADCEPLGCKTTPYVPLLSCVSSQLCGTEHSYFVGCRSSALRRH